LSCTLRRTDKEEEVDLRLDLVGIVVRDMRASLGFYRRLGLDIPEGAEDEPHAEATTPSGMRVAWDTVELMQDLDGALGRALYVPGFLVLESRRGRRDLR
jgi:catechol 2,3-dioxygenase-like lactoylglutathione lyase family enzyme